MPFAVGVISDISVIPASRAYSAVVAYGYEGWTAGKRGPPLPLALNFVVLCVLCVSVASFVCRSWR